MIYHNPSYVQEIGDFGETFLKRAKLASQTSGLRKIQSATDVALVIALLRK